MGCAQKSQQPQWYYHLQPKEDQLVGYGYGTTCKEAKLEALDDIAQSLHVEVGSRYYKRATNEHKEIQEDIVQIHPLIGLDNVKTLRRQDSSMGCYVALSLSMKPLALKAALVAKKEAIAPMPTHKMLYHTPFASTLKEILGYVPRYYVQNSGALTMLHIGSKSFSIASKSLWQFMPHIRSKSVDISISKEHLKVFEHYYIALKANKEGYLSLVYIDEKLRPQIAFANRYIYAKGLLRFPDSPKLSIEANMEGSDQRVYESYMALLCDGVIDLSLYNRLDESFYTPKSALGYGDLLAQIQGCAISSAQLMVDRLWHAVSL